jgi:SAM-dependent methyltransferase
MSTASFAPSLDAMRQIDYFVEWRPWLWSPAVRWAIATPERFRGRRVLEIGCRYGKMSCLYALLGAQVTGVDLSADALEIARREAARCGVESRTTFMRYSGDPRELPGDFDFVVTKSVLVIVPELPKYLAHVKSRMRPGGEFIALENNAGNKLVNTLRARLIHRAWKSFDTSFRGVDAGFVADFESSFKLIERKRFYALVTGLRGVA